VGCVNGPTDRPIILFVVVIVVIIIIEITAPIWCGVGGT